MRPVRFGADKRKHDVEENGEEDEEQKVKDMVPKYNLSSHEGCLFVPFMQLLTDKLAFSKVEGLQPEPTCSLPLSWHPRLTVPLYPKVRTLCTYLPRSTVGGCLYWLATSRQNREETNIP